MDDIMEELELVMSNNYMWYNEEHYAQINGVVMGAKNI